MRAPHGAPAPEVEAGPGLDAAEPGAGERWALEDRAEFLRRSITDADREHRAGDLSDRDHRLLRRRDEEQLAVVERSLAALGSAPSSPGSPPEGAAAHGERRNRPSEAAGHATGSSEGRPVGTGHRRHRRPWLAVLGSVLLVAGLVLGVIRATSPRLLGESATGSVQVNSEQLVGRQLAEAAQEVDQGTTSSIEEGLTLYRLVLREDPRQPQALAETGYLEWQAGDESGQRGLAERGAALVDESIAVEPDDYAAHFFAGTIDLRQGDGASAAAEFETFLSEHPPASLVASAAPAVRSAFAQAHRPAPAGLPPG